MYACANCGRTIGNLETPYLHNEQVVCGECAARLSSPAIDYETPARQPSARRRVQTIEKTGKAWKLLMLLSVLGMIAAVVMVAVAAQSKSTGPNAGVTIGILLFVAGFIGYIVARIGAWWYHG